MIEHLSYSSITTYLNCAANWKFKYIDQLPTYSTPELVLGTAVHNAVEAYLLGQGDLITVYPQAWEKAQERDKDKIFWGTDTPEQTYNEGVRLLSHATVANGIKSMNGGTAPQIETKVELRVPSVPVPIIGYIDVITADGIPGDFKTSRASWNQAKAQDSIQTLFYLAALNQAGVKNHQWKFRHYVIVKTKTPQFQVLEHTHKPAELFWLFSMISNIWKAIQSEVYPENPTTWLCSPEYCDFYKSCRGKYA
jgi:hypothetical protein